MHDLSGKNFGLLTVIKRNGNEPIRGGILWLCKCDCGVLCTKRGDFLRRGITKSCGCYRLKGRIKQDTSLNSLFANYKKDAKKRNYCFDLTKEYFSLLISKNCVYCGIEPQNTYKHRKNIEDSRACIYNGVDRIDNSIGYTIENSVTCCKTCNFMKGSISIQDWNKWLELLVKHWTELSALETL